MAVERDPFGRIIPRAKPRKPGQAQVVGQPQATRDFLKGIHAIADLLAPTLGPLGGRVAGSSNDNSRFELWDGSATIVRRVFSLGSPQADVGAMLLRNVVWRLEQRVGDGGATAAVLTRRLVERGHRLLAAGVNAMELARGLHEAGEEAICALQALSRPVDDEDALSNLALAATGERELSALLGEIRYLLGAEGHVRIEKLVAPWLARRYVNGAWISAQIASMYLYTDVATRSAVLNAPAVALLDEPLESADAALALLEAALAASHASLLILAPDVRGAALNLLVANQQQPADKRRITLLAATFRAVPAERAQQLDDLAVLAGATVLGAARGRSAAAVRAADLGFAERSELTGDGIALQLSGQRRHALDHEVSTLRSRLAALPFDDDERPLLVRRLATLTGGIAELQVGAHSQYERARLLATAERGLKVLTAAQRGGALPGGGSALLHARRSVLALVEESVRLPGDRVYGARLLAEALDAPLAQIARNAGHPHPVTVVHRLEALGTPWAWDAIGGEYVDAFAAGLLDATEVVTTALASALSAAAMALTTDVIVYHRNPEQSFEP